MVNHEFFEALRYLGKEKGIQMEPLFDSVQRAIVTAVRGDYNNKDVVYCDILPDTEEIKLYVRKQVVSAVEDEDTDMLPEQAERYKPGAQPGDIVEIELDTKEVGRIAAEKAKHVLRQGIREAEHGRLREEFQSREQEIVTVKVQRVEPNGDAVVEIGKVTEILPASEQVPGEQIAAGDLIKVYVVDISGLDRRYPHATLSRIHPGLVKRLFELEVPEVKDGLVEVKAVAREAGSRSKVAVWCKDPDVDAVGSCIGSRGSRIERVVDLLGGEKIDVVQYSDDVAEFVAAALSPAEVLNVRVVDNDEHVCHITVPENKLSLAIGNKGQNARLAAKLTTWKIDIKSDTQMAAPEEIVIADD
ncbi:MAG: transcription termination factor NusA [Oscillospiraceae bacterium]|jgi:N utilization substance protein A|nr:transcription termination factor NusA [Oscillospiraceae bacterium]